MKNVMFTKLNGDRPDVPNLAVIITDGKSDLSSRRSKKKIKRLKRNGIRVLLIGVELESATEFNNVADYIATENALLVPNFDELEIRMDEMYSAICRGNAW